MLEVGHTFTSQIYLLAFLLLPLGAQFILFFGLQLMTLFHSNHVVMCPFFCRIPAAGPMWTCHRMSTLKPLSPNPKIQTLLTFGPKKPGFGLKLESLQY